MHTQYLSFTPKHTCDGIVFDNELSGYQYALGETGKTTSYVLTDNIVATGGFEIRGDVHLCLNGKTIDMSNHSYGINIIGGASLSIYDCDNNVDQGVIKGCVIVHGTLNMYGGKIMGKSGYYTINTPDGATSSIINIYGGVCTSTGITNTIRSIGKVNIMGGEIISLTNLSAIAFRGTVMNISGGTIRSNCPNNSALLCRRGKTFISGGEIVSANRGAIYIESDYAGEDAKLYVFNSPTLSLATGQSSIFKGENAIVYANNADEDDLKCYSGDPLTIKVEDTQLAGDIIVRNVDNSNDDKFSISKTGYELEFAKEQPADQLNSVLKLKVEDYSITYLENGGSDLTDATYNIETVSFTLPQEPTRTGYNFDGFKVTTGATGGTAFALDEIFTAEQVVTLDACYGNVEITAQWTLIPYSITYNKNGGDFVCDDSGFETSYTLGDEYILPTHIIREGYVFDGWFTDSGYNGESKITSIVSTDIGAKNLFAKWKYIPFLNTKISVLQVYDYLRSSEKVNGPAFDSSLGFLGKATESNQFDTQKMEGFYFKIKTTGDPNFPYSLYLYDETGTAFVADDDNDKSLYWEDSDNYNSGLSTRIGHAENGKLSHGLNYEITDVPGFVSALKINQIDSSKIEFIANSEFGILVAFNDIYEDGIVPFGDEVDIEEVTTKIVYTVVHKIENLNDSNFTNHSTENFTVEKNGIVSPAVKIIEGFNSPVAQSVTISEIYQTITYEYTRKTFDVSFEFDSNKGKTSDTTSFSNLKYGAELTPPSIGVYSGYDLAGWGDDYTGQVSEDKTYTAEFDLIEYDVIYDENEGSALIDGTYTIEDTSFTFPEAPTRGCYNFSGFKVIYGSTGGGGFEWGTTYEAEETIDLTNSYGYITVAAQWTEKHKHTDNGTTLYFDDVDMLSGDVGTAGQITNYVITKDFELNQIVYIRGTVNLCLNGKTIITNQYRFAIEQDAVLNIYDCGEGKILSNNLNDTSVIFSAIYNGQLNIKGGTFESNSHNSIIALFGDSVFNLYNGVIEKKIRFSCYAYL